MSNKRQYFGTDGIRGKVGESLINPEFVLKLGWAAGMVLKNGFTENRVLIGKDTRISGYLLESVLEAGFIAAGINTYILGPMPTPGIAYLTRTFHANAGIVISASHNPYYDNGIKFFSRDGVKISDEIELAIEEKMSKKMEVTGSASLGKARRVDDAHGRYIEFCKSTMGLNQNLKGMKIVVDCSNGATYNIAPHVLSELGADITTIGNQPDGININDGCGSTHPDLLAKEVLKHNADLGVAFDGDGDRVVMVDENGVIVDGDELLFIMAQDYQKRDILNGGVAGTVMSNFGLEVALNEMKIPFIRTKVGDRHVLQGLQKEDWYLGGEGSGHILNLNLATTGDGIVSALQVLSILHRNDITLSQAKAGMNKMPQILINVRCVDKIDVDNNQTIQDAIKTAEAILQDKGRVLLRASGTQPLIRVMVEGEDESLIEKTAKELAAVVKSVSDK